MKNIFKILIVIGLVIASIGVLFVGQGYKMYKDAIKEVSIDEKVSQIRNDEDYIKISEVPEMYKKAVIAVEDHRFYKHFGIDIIAIGRATFNDLKAFSFIEGGSTITQQLAKNQYFTQEKKITRKIAETFLAFKLEKKYEKDEILELYINTIYFGNGYYGIKEAAMGYFGKLPKDLTDGECIMLAGIPNAPSVYALNENPSLAKQRQKQVMAKMIRYKVLTEEEAKEILNSD